MKLGFDNRREVIAMVILVVAALAFVSRVVFFKGDTQAAATKAAPTTTAGRASAPAPAAPVAGRNRRRAVLPGLRPSLDPSLRFDLLKYSEEREYGGGKRNIFQQHVEVAVAPKIDTPAPTPPPVDPGPPPPPPIPLKYYGFASKPGETRKVFLSNGDEVFVAEEGQIIQRRYKILKITASSVEVEDVLNNNKQILPLQQG